ncbi:hypothetical protein BVC71_05730 [Marivivens niveibacter]|uniref:Uncharacterized protein n=1 Tax=Marivivens niveibacter TaxID=1930667 RepID=A0A251X305_9RHOB|nr:heme-degrading domain-containing protein [Marivivens niveibacter]OUD10961.1 hypothetical protein BVC71_05730 [Marivivens niveibacter]
MSSELISAITNQEKRLVLDAFDENIAFELGCALRARAAAMKAPVSIEIRSASRRYFFATLPGATPENQDWGRRKINTVLRTYKSSMRAGLEYNAEGREQWPDVGLRYEDFVIHGGGFPIFVKNAGFVAAIGISGLPSIEDHEISTATLAEWIGITLDPLPR